MTQRRFALFALLAACGPSTPMPDASSMDVATHDSSPDATPQDTAQQDAATDTAPDVDATPALHGCTMFDDRSATNADRTVTFTSFMYTPKCMHVAVGQSVTFSGDFAVHQLRPGTAPSALLEGQPEGPANNPIAATDVGLMATFMFTTAGRYPYYCLDHEGTGMYGVIEAE
jgi:plastocyanin